MRRALGIGGVAVVAIASVALIVSSLTLNHTGNCASGASPYVIARQCPPEEIQSAAIFGVGLVVMIAGCFAVAFTFGSNAMFVAMGAAVTSTAVAILIDGAHSLLIMASIWGVMGVAFLIGGGIAWRRELEAGRGANERPVILG